jgi:hypothetical protein
MKISSLNVKTSTGRNLNQTSNVVMLLGLELQNNPYGSEVEQTVAHGPCCIMKHFFFQY